MAETTLLALPCSVNDMEMLIDGEINGLPAILSTKIADHFNKKHYNILRDIDTLQSILPISFCKSNFGLTYFNVPGPNSAVRKERAYLLTRDAFSLLVMGMTGKTAVIWKLRYIEAFNALEKAAYENSAALAHEAGYQQGRDETLSLPVMEAERRKGYLEGLKEGKKLAQKDDRLSTLLKIRSYMAKGLTSSEIGKLVGLSRSAVKSRIQRARKNGLLAYAPAKPVRGNLFGVAK